MASRIPLTLLLIVPIIKSKINRLVKTYASKFHTAMLIGWKIIHAWSSRRKMVIRTLSCLLLMELVMIVILRNTTIQINQQRVKVDHACAFSNNTAILHIKFWIQMMEHVWVVVQTISLMRPGSSASQMFAIYLKSIVVINWTRNSKQQYRLRNLLSIQ